MKVHEATEQAYKNGYAKGYADGKAETAEALEKQIPKKPRVDDNDWYCCRNCGDTFSLVNMVNDRNRYCGKCGQAVDWEGADNG